MFRRFLQPSPSEAFAMPHTSHPLRRIARSLTSRATNRLVTLGRVVAITTSVALPCLISPPSSTAAEPAREIFLFSPEQLADPHRQELMLKIPQLLQQSGDLTFHLVALPSHTVVTTLVVPQRLTSDVKRKPEFRLSWERIGRFIQASKPTGEQTPEAVAIDLPLVFAKVAATRRTSASPEVLVIGHPLYANPREPEFAMAPSYVFSDSAWFLDRGPFGQPVAPLPTDSQFQIVSTHENWGFDLKHQSAIERFYRVGIQHRLKGNLQPITTDLATALQALRSMRYQKMPGEPIETIDPNAAERDDRIWRITITATTFGLE